MPIVSEETGTAPPRVLSERYLLGPRIGRGGRSTVHLATDRLLGRQVAIRIFTERPDSVDELRRQEAEARLSASVQHYAVAALLDAGVDVADPDRPQIYLVMEHVPGGDLRTRIRRGPLPWAQVAWLGHDLSEGLAAVHEQGFLHGDITPESVLIASSETESRLRGKLTDLGIASSAASRGDAAGSAEYLAPERAQGDAPSPAAEVYSLGLVLLEALTGRTASRALPEPSDDDRTVRGVPVPASVPTAVAAVLRSMLATEPHARAPLASAALGFQEALIEGLVRERGAGVSEPAAAEADRLAALRRYNVLDTPPEPGYDRITRLAGRTLEAPVAAIAFLDFDRVWLKSRHGDGLEEADRRSPVVASGDVLRDRPWTVFDLRADDAPPRSPLVSGEPRIRSFAAAPLITLDGHRIGALYVGDVVPRVFSDEQLASLGDFAGIVLNEMELRLASRRALFGA